MAKLCVIGAINWDINYLVDHLPAPGEEVLARHVETCPGGTGANVATAAARVMVPGEVAMIGGLGRDDIAQGQRTLMASDGIDTSGVLTLDAGSGTAHIAIDAAGENTIITIMGANALVTAEAMHTPVVERLLWSADVVVITDPPLSAIPVILELAEKATIIWDPGVRVMEAELMLQDKVDYLVLNQVEAEHLDREVLGSTQVIEKLGRNGCRTVREDEPIEAPGVDLKSLGKTVVNTVGCGDAFLGVFAASLAQELPLTECLERANLAGALNATKKETRGSPTAKEMEEALNPPEGEV